MNENAYDVATGLSRTQRDEPDAAADAPRQAGPEERSDEASDADEVTGASPGTAQACSDLGLNSLESNLERFGIKPPGMS